MQTHCIQVTVQAYIWPVLPLECHYCEKVALIEFNNKRLQQIHCKTHLKPITIYDLILQERNDMETTHLCRRGCRTDLATLSVLLQTTAVTFIYVDSVADKLAIHYNCFCNFAETENETRQKSVTQTGPNC